MLVLVLVLVPAGALAQTVPNGNFDDQLEQWTFGQGVRYVKSPTAPTPPGYAQMVGNASDAWVESAPFMVTRDRLSWSVRGMRYAWEVRDADLVVWAPGLNDPQDAKWDVQRTDVGGACGLEVTLLLKISGGSNSVLHLDSVAMDGAPCPGFVDQDGDGFCALGTDIDEDGDCSGEGEQSDEVVDCNDWDAAVGPGFEEVVGSGIDEDCDGLELCYEDADGDGFGSDRTVLSEVLDCTAPGLAARPGDRCEGADDRIDANANGIPDGCEDGEGVDPNEVEPEESALFRGAGFGCTHGPAPASAALWLLGLGLTLRRRR